MNWGRKQFGFFVQVATLGSIALLAGPSLQSIVPYAGSMISATLLIAGFLLIASSAFGVWGLIWTGLDDMKEPFTSLTTWSLAAGCSVFGVAALMGLIVYGSFIWRMVFS